MPDKIRPVNERRLHQIKNRARLALAGPRRIDPDGSVSTPLGRIVTLAVTGAKHILGPNARANARWLQTEKRFYETAREDILDLVAVVEELRTENAALYETLDATNSELAVLARYREIMPNVEVIPEPPLQIPPLSPEKNAELNRHLAEMAGLMGDEEN